MKIRSNGVLLALACMLLLALPAAALYVPMHYIAPAPMEAYNPTPVEVTDQIARQNMARRPEHFKCRDYNGQQTPATATPTANVVVTIMADPNTSQSAVITVDPRIIIGYHKIIEQSQYGIHTTQINQYNWSFAHGVEPYAVFFHGVGPDGHEYWAEYTPQQREDGAYVVNLYGGDDEVTMYIVATDTHTCEAGNPLPSDFWKEVTER